MRRGDGYLASALRLAGRWDGRLVSRGIVERLCDGVARAWPWSHRRDRNLADLEAQFNLYHTSPIFGKPIYYTRSSHDPARLRGPVCNFKLDQDGRLWVYTDDLSGWWQGWTSARLWWFLNAPVIAALQRDFTPAEGGDDHNRS